MCLSSFTDISEPEEVSDEETDVESEASESPGMPHFICKHLEIYTKTNSHLRLCDYKPIFSALIVKYIYIYIYIYI